MKLQTALHVAGFALTGLVLAPMAPAQTEPGAELPPPGINDPGVKPAPATTAPMAARSSHDALPGGNASADQSPPDVNIRREGDDIVQEYSHNGRIYMIKVIPKKGVTQTYRDVNGDGRLDTQPGKAPVAPVYYTLYEWGKAKPKKGK